MHKVDRISTERWLSLRAERPREMRKKTGISNPRKFEEDQLCRPRSQDLDEALKQAQKYRMTNNNLYLCECCIHLEWE